MQGSYIEKWNEKFGQEAMLKWMKTYNIAPDSFIFKFQPTHFLDKIENIDDLFEFSNYVGGYEKSKIISYYATKCNNFYQEKNQKVLEIENEEDEDENENENINEILELVWENVQDISIALTHLKESESSLNEILELTAKIEKTLSTLDSRKIEKNAKYNQVEEIKDILKQNGNQYPKHVKKKNRIEFLKDKKLILFILTIIFSFILGGILL